MSSDSGRPARLAELIAALSLATDLGLGQPMEHVLRSCLISMRLGELRRPSRRQRRPTGPGLYGSSLAYCMPVSLATGGAGLGTLGLPPSRLSHLAYEAGFTHMRQVPIDDPFNNLYELTP